MRQLSLGRTNSCVCSPILLLKDRFAREGVRWLALGVAAVSSLLFAAEISAQTTYRDPSGNFSVDAPAGWRAEKSSQTSMVFVSRGNVTVSLDVVPTSDGGTPEPKEVLDGLEKGLTKDCPTATAQRRGNATLAGQAAVFVQLACNQAQGTTLMIVEVATRNGQILLANISVAANEYPSVKPAVDSIIQSFRLGVGDPAPAAAGGGSGSGPTYPPAGSDAKLQALEQACKAGVFTPEECAAKRAQLRSGGSGGGSQNPPGGSGWTDFSGGPLPNTGNAQGGTVYNDPSGAFRLTIPQGWTAKTKSGCYGPPENCPPNASGVNIYQGDDWAFVAPFSAQARRPTDVVNVVAQQYQGQYQNLKMLQNEPQKFNGLDIALGQFSATDPNGVNVSLVVIGIAAPNGRFYLACSSIPLSDAPTAGPALSAMLQTLEFAGQ